MEKLVKNKKRLNDLIEIQARNVFSDHLVTSSRTWLDVADVMSKDVATIRPDEIAVSAAKVMSEKMISCLVIMDNANVAGILTETDILRRVVSNGKDFYQTKLDQIMSCPVESVPFDLSVLEASKIMGKKHIKRLPILEDDKLVGIVTQTDLVRALTSYGMWRDIAEIMSQDVAGIQSKASVAEAAEAMTSQKISCIVVRDGDEVVGVLTEKDLLGQVVALQRDPACVRTEEIMSSPVTSIPPHYSVFSASRIMEEMNIRRLVVTKDKRLCGVVTQTDIFMAVKSKLQADEEKNIGLLEESESNIYTTDLDGMITYVNPAFMKLLEVSDPAELVGQPFLPKRFWFNLEERKQFLGELRKGSIESKELTLKTSKGKKIYVIVFSGFTKNIHSQINGSQGILYDITTKKELVTLRQAEEKLREKDELNRTILDSLPFFAMLIRKDRKILFANQMAREVGAVIGGYCWRDFGQSDFIPDEDAEYINQHKEIPQNGTYCYFCKADEALENQLPTNNEIEAWGKIWDAHWIPISKEAYLHFACDITEHKKTEDTIKKSEQRARDMAVQAKIANETKSRFLANMSHEIRTPMNAIIGFSQILAEENFTEEQKEYVNIIQNSGTILLKLINDILDFSKIEADKIDVEIVDCRLDELLTSIESLMHLKAEQKSLEFHIAKSDALPAWIRTDLTRLHQCLANLTGNAIKFTETGHVYVNVSLERNNDKPFIRFDVEDTGIGIPPDKNAWPNCSVEI
jgi:PAS domain S-box-containing protein